MATADFKIDIGTLLKIAFPILIILGVTRLTSYYYQFNLSIIDYLDFSEIITLFLNDFSLYLIVVLPLLIYYPVETKYETAKMIFIFFLLPPLVIINLINGSLVFNGILLAFAL